MNVIGKVVEKEVIDEDKRRIYFDDGSETWEYIGEDENRHIDNNERKIYFNDENFKLKIKKDEQGREISSEYKLGYYSIVIERSRNNSDADKLSLKGYDGIIFDEKELEPIKDGYAEPVDFLGRNMIAEYSNNKLQGWVIVDEDECFVGERDIRYYPNGNKHHDYIHYKINDGVTYKQDVYYHENGNVAGMLISTKDEGGKIYDKFWEERYNSEGALTYRAMGSYSFGFRKEVSCLEVYDENGKILHSMEPGDVGHAATNKYVDYDENGKPLIITYKSAIYDGKVVRIIDNNEKTYPNGQKKFELNADGSKTKFYETGEVLSQKDKDGKETFYYKDGKERMVIETDGTKNVNYGNEQFLLISGRHCQKDDRGNLAEEGKKQAENIGKFIVYASQGKIPEMSHVVLPEVHSYTGNSRRRSGQTANIILETINNVLQRDDKYEKVECRYSVEECKHNANAELSINSMCEGYDTADDKMGSIAFSVIGRDGVVIDRVVFNAKQIAQEVERVEKIEHLMQQTKSKLEKFREETMERDVANPQVLSHNESKEKEVITPKRLAADVRAAILDAKMSINK